MELIESELYKNKKNESTRKGMLRALTEDYFSQLIKIAEDEEEIEKK